MAPHYLARLAHVHHAQHVVRVHDGVAASVRAPGDIEAGVGVGHRHAL